VPTGEFSWFPMPRRDPPPQPGTDGDGQSRSQAGSDAGGPSAEEIGKAVVDCGLYEGGKRRGGRIDLDTALKRASECTDGWVWIGLHDPSAEVVEAVGEHFQLPPLAVEDAVHAHQRAKLETYGDILFMVLKTARYVDHEELVEIGELMVFVGASFVVTVRHGEGSPLGDVRKDLEAHPDLLSMGPSSVLYAVGDRVVDDYAEVIEGFEDDIEEVEAEVFSGAGSNPAQRIYKLKREVLEFRRAVNPLVAPMQRLTDHQTGLPIDPRTRDYFRDVLDHLLRDSERIQGFDEILGGVLQANLTQLTVRDNQDLRKLSAWVAIIAVPTMVFGLYGMNFTHMPELEWRVGYPLVLIVILIVCAALYWRLKRSGWL
jgi:magnesium transporter